MTLILSLLTLALVGTRARALGATSPLVPLGSIGVAELRAVLSVVGNDEDVATALAVAHEAVQRNPTPECDDDGRTTWLLCVAHDEHLQQSLRTVRASFAQAATVHASKAEGRVCLLASAHPAQIERNFGLRLVVRAAVPMPAVWKTDPELFNHGTSSVDARGPLAQHRRAADDSAGLVVLTWPAADERELERTAWQWLRELEEPPSACFNTKRARLHQQRDPAQQSLRRRLEEQALAQHGQCNWSSLRPQADNRAGVFLANARAMAADDLFDACLALLVSHLESQPQVLHVRAGSSQVERRNDKVRWIVQTGVADRTPFTDANLTGIDQVVGIADTGLDEYSCYFFDVAKGTVPRGTRENPIFDLSQRKVVQYVAFVDAHDQSGSSGHGTNVAGAVGGKVYSGHPKLAKRAPNNGMAEDCKIAFYDIGSSSGSLSIPGDGQDMYSAAFNASARIHTDSWGASCSDSSSSGCSYLRFDNAIDSFSFDHPEFLVLVAAGNDGEDSYADPTSSRYGKGTVGSPGHIKNGLTVGAHDSFFNNNNLNWKEVSYFSSLGPSADGRIKPDLLGPGQYVEAAKSIGYTDTASCAMVDLAGTSQATPVIASAAAMLRQYFERGVGGYAEDLTAASADCSVYYCDSWSPTGALIKAMLVTAARGEVRVDANDDVGDIDLRQPPDSFQGFGRVQLDRVLGRWGQDLFVRDNTSIAQDETHTYKYDVVNDSIPFQATLTWYDPPNAAYATAKHQVLHDLDLLVVDSEGAVYSPNCNMSNFFCKHADALRRRDSEIDNVQKIVISNLTNGSYTIEVRAVTITETNKQPYALVVSGGGSVRGSADISTPTPTTNVPAPTPAPTQTPTTPPTPSPSHSPCPKTCFGYTCAVIDQYYGETPGTCDYQTLVLESYNCDCNGCSCDSAAPTPAPSLPLDKPIPPDPPPAVLASATFWVTAAVALAAFAATLFYYVKYKVKPQQRAKARVPEEDLDTEDESVNGDDVEIELTPAKPKI